MKESQLIELVNDLVKQPKESEWVEFKLNYHSPDKIGERLSALSNGACLHNINNGYLVFGVEDKTHAIKGTSFNPKITTKGKEELENWLVNRLNPRIDFRVYQFNYNSEIKLVVFVIPAASNKPVAFLNTSYIRVGSYTRKLIDFPEKDYKNAAIASRILKDTLEDNMIKEDDPTSKSRKHKSYIPFWA